MKPLLVLRSWFFVPSTWLLLACSAVMHANAADQGPRTKNQEQAADEVFRPEAGKFPPLEKAHAYRGELVFVDHPNRRGSIRVQGSGMFFRNDPHPFALLPYAEVKYHGAPADIMDIPLGTVLYVRAFLPPDPKISPVPVLPLPTNSICENTHESQPRSAASSSPAAPASRKPRGTRATRSRFPSSQDARMPRRSRPMSLPSP